MIKTLKKYPLIIECFSNIFKNKNYLNKSLTQLEPSKEDQDLSFCNKIFKNNNT